MSDPTEDRIRRASWETYDGKRRLITRGDALAILGRGHPLRPEVEGMPCLGNHKVGYCAGVVVDADTILAAILARRPTEDPDHA